MPEGGTLSVGASKYPDITNKNWINIQIIDTGTGLAGDIVNHIFEPFFSTKGPGRGYGLWRSKGYIEGMGGTLALFSEVRGGTRVEIMLPLP
jgi:signal transduction histidine kinase